MSRAVRAESKAPRAWWLLMALAIAIALYALSFYIRGARAFSPPLATGIIGGYMAAYAYGGLSTQLGFAGLGVATFAATFIAYQHALARRWVHHRAWMERSYALIFAAVTLRVELPLLAMAFRGFDPAYAIVSWLCWVPNLAVAEMIVRRTTAPLLPRAG